MSIDPNDSRAPYIQVASSLRAAILTQVYEPGDKLPSLRELVAYYGVSAEPVRSALLILQAEGLVEGHQGKGVFVVDRTDPAA